MSQDLAPATPYLRLRQICLVAPRLDAVVADLEAVFGVQVAWRDPQVAAFGLENAVLPFGPAFVEVVAPLTPNCAAARFLARNGGQGGGYMAIFNCDDPRRRQAHAASLGVSTVAELEQDGFTAVQLHPRDCRAAMIEFDRTEGERDLNGPYHAAGGTGWTRAVRTEVTLGLRTLVLQSAEPVPLGRHWAALLERPFEPDADGAGGCIGVDLCRLQFVAAPPGTAEGIAALQVAVRDADAVLARARARGLGVTDQAIRMGGIRFEPINA